MSLTKKQLVKAIKDTAKANNIEPYQVKPGDLQEHSGISVWQVRQFGGLSSVIKAEFPTPDKDLKSIVQDKGAAAYIAKLEKELGNRQLFEESVLDALKAELKPLPKVKLVNVKRQKTKQKREIVMMLNDTHYGLVVDPNEVNGVNAYDWREACRRTAMVVAEAIDFKPHTREEVETAHLVLNGDLICGLIHGTNTKGVDLYVRQLNGALHILTHVVANLLANFKNVQVHGIGGNHCNAIHKREHGNRVVSEVWDNYANGIYYGLSTAFRDNNRVTFNFPKTPYGFIDLPGGRAMYGHGDTIFSRALGNPGTVINVKSMSEEVRKFNLGETQRGRQAIKLLLLGHTHCYHNFINNDGVHVYNAPSLSGTDGFAHQLNINNNFVGQVVFESTRDYIMGDHRLIRVQVADNNAALDKIIPTYTGELSWKK